MKKHKNWLKGAALALALAMAIPVVPAVPAQAAAKKVTVSVKSPKSGVKRSGSKLTIHGKKAVRLTVKSGKSNITSKASLKSSSPKVISVGGQLVPKKNGKATVTVKYKGISKKLNITVAGHSWKAHKKTKTVNMLGMKCNCGKVILDEKKYCEECSKYSAYCRTYGYCCCKAAEHTRNHILKGEPSNYQNISVPKKVKYIDYYQCSCGAKKKGEIEPK